MSALLHFFEVHVFTLVFGEDLFLLPSGVGFRGTAAGVLATCVLLFACIKIGSRLLVGTVGHVDPIREANSKSDKMKFRMRPKAMPKKTINPTTRAKRHPSVEFIR